MRLKARFVEVLLYRIAVVALAWIVTGCASKSAKLPTYMRPELLYLSDRPYSRLYVEVDTIEGVDVPDQWLDDLKSLLGNHCSKPDGIDFVVDEPVLLSEIKDMPIGPASILCLDGPDADSEPRPAYLHVFFYDKDKVFKKATKSPHVKRTCPCAIFYNVGYYSLRRDEFAKFALVHEAGHLLGLCKSTAHGNGVHCRNHGCVMNPSPGLLPELGLLMGAPLKGEFCADCLSDLETWKSEDAGRKLAFNGPFLIRREDGYSVASLPYCDLILPAALEDEFDWQEALAQFKETIREKDYGEYWKEGVYRICGLIRPDGTEEVPEGMVDYQGILTKAAEDPNPVVKHYAMAELEKLRKRRE